jgi:hypothetical protein
MHPADCEKAPSAGAEWGRAKKPAWLRPVEQATIRRRKTQILGMLLE